MFLYYLTGPQGNEGAEGVPCFHLRLAHLFKSGSKRNREASSGTGLDLDLRHFQGAEGDVSENFGRSRTSEPDGRLVFFTELFTSQVHVGIFEKFVETILEHALERVSDKRGAKAFPDTFRTLFSNECFESAAKGVVLGGVDLRG
jgi:hypothetical protein